MFFLLFLITAIRTVIAEDKYKLVATVLYYSDDKGRVLLVTGPLPKDAEEAIQNDIKTRLTMQLPISVVPIYNSVSEIPSRRNVVKHIEDKFPAVYVANISRESSLNIFSNMRKYMTSPLQQYWLRKQDPPQSSIIHARTDDDINIPSIQPLKAELGVVTDSKPHAHTSPKDADKLNPADRTQSSNFSNIDPSQSGMPANPLNSGNSSNSPDNSLDSGGINNNSLGPPISTNFSSIDPSKNEKRLDKNLSVRPYSFIDPLRTGKASDLDPVKPLITNFSYIDKMDYQKTTPIEARPNTISTPYDSAYKPPNVAGTAPSTKSFWSKDDFIPNDIYYGIEKTCANWNNVCSRHGHSLNDMPASYIKFPYHGIKPPILQWDP